MYFHSRVQLLDRWDSCSAAVPKNILQIQGDVVFNHMLVRGSRAGRTGRAGAHSDKVYPSQLVEKSCSLLYSEFREECRKHDETQGQGFCGEDPR